MKVVLRHQLTGRYYAAPGQWVRRADNALSFDDIVSALHFIRLQRLSEARPVYRFAPFLIPLLNDSGQPRSKPAGQRRWHSREPQRFAQN